MPPAPVPPRPPLVVYGSRTAWLRAWRKGEAHWLALVFWDDRDDQHRYVIEKWVTADDLTKVDGEDYTAVPRLNPLADT